MPYENKTGFPSSTQILSPFIDTSYFLPEHAERGTAVHDALSAYLSGVWVVPVKQEWQGYVDSGMKWIDAMVDKVTLVEKRLIDSELGYCGKPDLICSLKNDARQILIDWKTAIAKGLVWSAQIASYRQLAEVDMGIQTHRGASIRLKPDGTAALFEEYINSAMDWSAFLCALNAYKFFMKG